jgi:hypothetical protein
MRNARVLVPLLLVALPLTACSRGPGGLWLDDPDEAFALAAETGKPLLFVFR